MRPSILLSLLPALFLLKAIAVGAFFVPSLSSIRRSKKGVSSCWSAHNSQSSSTALGMAQISEEQASANIAKVVAALRKDKSANSELGRLEKVMVVLGYGSPSAGIIAVRFNASFRRGGMGRSALPMPFMLGQTNKSEGRGTMVGQVKASLDEKTGKITSCSVFRDLGYGRSFNMKV
jgi:hypothetical protein